MITIVPAGRHRRPRFTPKTVVVGTMAAVVLGAAGVGYAAWSVSASGSSQATSGTPVAGVVTTATPTSSLYPGGSTGLFFTVTNPNSFPVTYTAQSYGTITVDDATACPATNVTVNNTAVSISLAAGATSTVQSPASAITMSSSAGDGCQGRTFTVATTLTGASG